MTNQNDKTISNINEKLDWAIRSLERIRQSGDNRLLIQDNFWSFLTAFKQSWFYYFHLIAQNSTHLTSKERNKIGISIIESWKMTCLTFDERQCWETLQKVRDFDTHNEPLMPIVEEREAILADELGHILIDDNDIALSLGVMIFYFIRFEDQEYNIVHLADNGIAALRKLIAFIPTLAVDCFTQ